MSGLCAVFQADGRPIDERLLRTMAAEVTFRGPDGLGIWCGDGAGLAFLSQRLTPESRHETQPLADDGSGIVVVFDGRLDNRADLVPLRSSADRAGRRSELSDAVLVRSAFERWGTDCGRHLIGDFAAVIWDGPRRRLFALRDSAGMRALYYATDGSRTLLATEIGQLLALPGPAPRLNERALAAHLAMVHPPSHWTCYEGIARLPPASALVADPGGVRTWRYWDIDPAYRIDYDDEDDYAEHFLDLFNGAVRARLRSLAPVGLMMSGGLDSAGIGASAGRIRADPDSTGCAELRAYNLAYEELVECDERRVSIPITDHYAIPAVPVPADERWPLRDYPNHGPQRDDPDVAFYQPSIDRCLETARADGVSMMMTGTYGDAVMGGGVFDYLDQVRQGHPIRALRELAGHRDRGEGSLLRVACYRLLGPAAALVWPAGTLEPVRRPLRRLLRRPPRWPPWLRPDFVRRTGLDELVLPPPRRREFPEIARRQRHELLRGRDAMRNEPAERVCAHHGLAYGDPWTDRRLWEFVLAIPQRLLNRAGEHKRLMRRAMRGVMPEQARLAAGKTFPLALGRRGLCERESEAVQKLLTDSVLSGAGIIDEAAARSAHGRLCREDFGVPLWPTLSAEMWLRRYWT
jgi:asparagine synthase (glutamine-hydrolysing)